MTESIRGADTVIPEQAQVVHKFASARIGMRCGAIAKARFADDVVPVINSAPSSFSYDSSGRDHAHSAKLV
jgi:hypothetical protein